MSTAAGKKVNLADLEPQQLLQFKSQMNSELDNLQNSFRALRMAQMKYKECKANVQQVSKSQDEEIMVPLTGSLYMPGKVSKADKFLIDVGTGYYVEKSAEDATKFFDARLKKLTEDSTQLTALIKEKAQLSQRVDDVLKQKLQQQQNELEKNKKQQAAASA